VAVSLPLLEFQCANQLVVCAPVQPQVDEGSSFSCGMSVAGILDWFRGRDPRIQPAAFKAKWCQRGVIASLQPPSAGHPFGEYVFRLSAAGV
jgi:hypothetical protein